MRFSIFLVIFFTGKKSIFNAKNENSENSESSENSHKNLTAMGSYSYYARKFPLFAERQAEAASRVGVSRDFFMTP